MSSDRMGPPNDVCVCVCVCVCVSAVESTVSDSKSISKCLRQNTR